VADLLPAIFLQNYDPRLDATINLAGKATVRKIKDTVRAYHSDRSARGSGGMGGRGSGEGRERVGGGAGRVVRYFKPGTDDSCRARDTSPLSIKTPHLLEVIKTERAVPLVYFALSLFLCPRMRVYACMRARARSVSVIRTP
jgi:hypothetical protein